jgi:acyl-CoA reductase-like NAD-dependent aldehyde dehydrogenase
MGGIDPLIVLEFAPLEATAEGVARGAFGYAGQVCTSSKRLLIRESVADAFAQRLAERARSRPRGPSAGREHRNAEAIERLDPRVQDARGRSAEVLAGGARAPGTQGTFYAPTVLDHAPEATEVAREGPCGPIPPIRRFAGIEDALRPANGKVYGPRAAVFTRDIGPGSSSHGGFGLARST